ncbi:hypothetical protein HDU98_008223 [Podochytrium sp. JEL0797]|nr:hypothetical protein HDU98_008223 [Podochytrium sp. JEL0797]
MPNNKKHKVSKIKGAESAHPYSRKAGQMRRAYAREEKVEKLKTNKDADRTREVDRLVWFKYAMPDDVDVATPEMVHDLIDQYIHRYSDEIEELKSQIRPNRLKPAKIAMYELLMGKDKHEYDTGMKMPNLTDAANVVRLRRWEGDYNGISAVKMVSVVASKKPVAAAAADVAVEASVKESEEPMKE